jgi:hypothetical protein
MMWNDTKALSQCLLLLQLILSSSATTAAAVAGANTMSVTTRMTQGSTAPDKISSRLIITVSCLLFSL